MAVTEGRGELCEVLYEEGEDGEADNESALELSHATSGTLFLLQRWRLFFNSVSAPILRRWHLWLIARNKPVPTP